MQQKMISVEATDLPDAWFQTVYRCLEVGRDFTVGQGSYAGDKRLEFDFVTIQIKNPCGSGQSTRIPTIPSQYNIPNPTTYDYVFGGPSHEGRPYVEYIMGTNMEENESYTYGQRLTTAPIGQYFMPDLIFTDDAIWNNEGHILSDDPGGEALLNQIELAIWRYLNYPQRTNQIVLQVAQPNDLLLKDPPCLRHIATRIQDGKLHFYIYFRSWDLWGGFPANLAALSVLMDYMAEMIGVDTGEFICISNGLHLYKYVWELAEIIRGKTIEQFRKEVVVADAST